MNENEYLRKEVSKAYLRIGYLEGLLLGLRRGINPCWCALDQDSPITETGHTRVCDALSEAMKDYV